MLLLALSVCIVVCRNRNGGLGWGSYGFLLGFLLLLCLSYRLPKEEPHIYGLRLRLLDCRYQRRYEGLGETLASRCLVLGLPPSRIDIEPLDLLLVVEEAQMRAREACIHLLLALTEPQLAPISTLFLRDSDLQGLP